MAMFVEAFSQAADDLLKQPKKFKLLLQTGPQIPGAPSFTSTSPRTSPRMMSRRPSGRLSPRSLSPESGNAEGQDGGDGNTPQASSRVPLLLGGPVSRKVLQQVDMNCDGVLDRAKLPICTGGTTVDKAAVASGTSVSDSSPPPFKALLKVTDENSNGNIKHSNLIKVPDQNSNGSMKHINCAAPSAVFPPPLHEK
eukprot:gnl/TRDRNA2_/TRDRNA2_144832_c2_seq1.p1 gnl/TRDRNA2_/TRDRNA2_144832_c2~~gnl/TRDRNA2_/TRDRNA2_144832_c2_seq1.p1  ORF type:complete len:204 (+),score=29.10 gnl/TRDRNA2_/TRDRNA2_144832_c2_seq1:26-613(+)